jgi:hypothetical protein
MAADEVFTFFFLMADANHDGNVNLSDFNILAANFGQSPRDFTQADFTYDGLVNLADFNILAARFGMSLAPNGTISPPNGTAPSLLGRGAAGERASGSMTTPGSTTGATTGHSLGKIEGSLAIPTASPSRARGTKAGAASTARASRSPSSTTTASSQLGSTSRTATGARLVTPFNDTLIALQQTSPRVA